MFYFALIKKLIWILFLESVHYNFVQNFKCQIGLFKQNLILKFRGLFYLVKITLKITLDGTTKSHEKTTEFQNQVLFEKTNLTL